jgi:hypothetical protein
MPVVALLAAATSTAPFPAPVTDQQKRLMYCHINANLPTQTPRQKLPLNNDNTLQGCADACESYDGCPVPPCVNTVGTCSRFSYSSGDLCYVETLEEPGGAHCTSSDSTSLYKGCYNAKGRAGN